MPLFRSKGRPVLVIAAVALALTIVEIALRWTPGVFNDDLLEPDQARGWALKRSFDGWVRGENTLWVTTNSDGLRDREHALEPPPNTVRVAVLGDSYVQGINVPIEKTLTSYLESSLTACLRPRARQAEVMNFGVSGYGTAQELLTYRVHAAKYKPNIVVLAVYTQNDIFNNVRELNPTDFPERSPYFLLDGDRLVLDESFTQALADAARRPAWQHARIFATDHSRVARLLHMGWAAVRPRLIAAPVEPEDNAPEIGDRRELIYQPPVRPEIEHAWRVTEALMSALNEEVRAHGAELWIVTLANGIQIEPDPRERRALAARLGVEDLSYPDDRIHSFAVAHGIRSITLAPAMAEFAERNKVYFNGGYSREAPLGDGHWNETANRFAADQAAAVMCPALESRP